MICRVSLENLTLVTIYLPPTQNSTINGQVMALYYRTKTDYKSGGLSPGGKEAQHADNYISKTRQN